MHRLLAAVLAAGVLFALPAAAQAQTTPGSPDVVISEVYGGGGNTGAPFQNDFVELFNRGGETVSLAGRSVQYASATGTGNFAANSPVALTGDIAPGQRVLVQLAGGANGQPLPSPDVTGTINMSATGGKVVLVDQAGGLQCNGASDPCAGSEEALIRDLVGYGTANYSETAPAPGTSNTTSVQRNAGGCDDTDNNAADFTAGPPSPQNRGAAPTPCGGPPGDAEPFVADSDPGNGDTNVPRDTNISVDFSEPVTAVDQAFALSCNGDDVPLAVSRQDDDTYVLDPQEELPGGSSCTLTVEGDDYADDDLDDPPDTGRDYSATFTTAAIEGLRIHDIQGRQHLSPYRNFLVAGVPGVVTATRFNGFYIQDPQPDTDPRTSEGIFIFTGSGSPQIQPVGTAVTVSGRVTEFRGGCTPSCTPPDFEDGEFGDSAFANLTITEIDRATVTPVGGGTVAATIVGRGGRTPPRTVIDDDTPDPQLDDPPLITGNVEDKSSAPGDTANQDPTFDPHEDGIDFYESLEGMLTRVRDAVVVEPTNTFSVGSPGENSEIAVLADRGRDASVLSDRGPIVARSFDNTLPHEYRRGDFNPERIILNDPVARDNDLEPAPQDAEVGDRFEGSLDAVVDYSFGNYKFLVREFTPLDEGRLEPERARRADRDELSVASYNVENLDPINDAERIMAIARQIRDNLRSPDILGLQEVQDNDGEGPGGPNGDASWTAIVEALATLGVEYDYRQIDPVHNQDGGAPNANIRVGFLFRPDRVTFVDRAGGTAVTATEDDPAQPGAQLTFSPGRIEPQNEVWEQSRKPVAGEFRFRGRKLFVVSNHFASKGGDAPLFGRFQEPYRPSELQRRGTTEPVEDPQRGQAGVVNGWVERLLDVERNARIVVLGDINDFEFSETIRVLERGAPGSDYEMLDLWRLLPQDERYSYIFQGNAQVLDHILVTESLLRAEPRFDGVHINSEFSEEQQSDHDPPHARFSLDDDDDDDDRDDDD